MTRCDPNVFSWDYGYDNLGQVTSGKHKWQDNTFVAGQQFEYVFDQIGNRTSTKVGGDASGGSLRPAAYVADFLNRYSQRDVSGYVDILGLAIPSTAVTVNGNSTYRKGEYFDYALPIGNSGAAQYPTVTVNSGAESSSGKVFVPKTPEQYDDPSTPTVNEGYDADGNQLRDGRWNYTWDAENRLVKMESLSGAPSGSNRRLEFGYDYMGRRVWSKITNLDTSTVLSERRFLYDGWNLVAELSSANAVIRTYVWGTDLSGTAQGAGGVGGLLKVNQLATPATTCFVAFDGNGNVAGLIDAANGSVAARYEYGPFGEVIRATGPMAKVNPIRWSTKYQDEETDLLYYGYRYYSASTGRWLSRDPIEEEGEKNLYGFVYNNSGLYFDILGREPGCIIVTIPSEPEDTALNDIDQDLKLNQKKRRWTVFHVDTINDANGQLKGANCACISVLNIIGHGVAEGGVQGVGSKNRDALAVQEDGTVKGLELFKGVKNFCKPCTIYLRGCNTSAGRNGKILLKKIANATGCKTWGWKSPTTQITSYQGLPGGGGPPGPFWNGPSDSADPDK